MSTPGATAEVAPDLAGLELVARRSILVSPIDVLFPLHPGDRPLVLEGEAGELFERLRAWRVARAAEEKVPAYVVFTDLTLQAIAEARPSDTRSLLRINGVGQTKLTKYGDDVLALVGGSD